MIITKSCGEETDGGSVVQLVFLGISSILYWDGTVSFHASQTLPHSCSKRQASCRKRLQQAARLHAASHILTLLLRGVVIPLGLFFKDGGAPFCGMSPENSDYAETDKNVHLLGEGMDSVCSVVSSSFEF